MILLSSKNISITSSRSLIKSFNPKAEVSICFIELDKEILLLKNSNKTIQNEKWGAPGGKLKPNETSIQAVKREIFEETGINLEVNSSNLMYTLYSRIPEIDSILYIFQKTLFNFKKNDIIINHKEHSQYLWCSITDCFKLDLMQGEIEIINLLYGKFLNGFTRNNA